MRSVQATGQLPPPLVADPRGYRRHCRDVLAPSTPRFASGSGPSGLDVAARVADRRVRPGGCLLESHEWKSSSRRMPSEMCAVSAGTKPSSSCANCATFARTSTRKQGLAATDVLWVADITYLRSWEGRL